MSSKFKIAVLVSGGGTNLQAIIDNINSGYLDCEISMVISDRENIYAIERAKENNIPTCVLLKEKYNDSLSDEILRILNNKVDLIVLAGWLSILKGRILEQFENKIINIHPSLIPSFCGNGMFGIKVHEKVIEYGAKVSGCTVHIVNKHTDGGPIILQKTVDVDFNDTAKTLQQKVLKYEHQALSQSIKYFIENRICVVGRRVKIL